MGNPPSGRPVGILPLVGLAGLPLQVHSDAGSIFLFHDEQNGATFSETVLRSSSRMKPRIKEHQRNDGRLKPKKKEVLHDYDHEWNGFNSEVGEITLI